MSNYKVKLQDPVEMTIGAEHKNIVSFTFCEPTGLHVSEFSKIRAAYNKALMSFMSQKNDKTDNASDDGAEQNAEEELSVITIILSANSDAYEKVHADFKKLLEVPSKPATILFNDSLDVIESVYSKLSMKDLDRMLAAYVSFFLS